MAKANRRTNAGTRNVRSTASLDADVRCAIGLHQAGETARAQHLYKKILRQKPGHPAANNLLGLLYFQRGELLDALPFVQSACTNSPGTAKYHYDLGVVLQQIGDHAAAAHALRTALGLDNQDAMAHDRLGCVMQELVRPLEALPHHDQACSLNPGNANFLNHKGLALLSLDRLDEALQYFRRALDIDSRNPHVQLNLGVALQKTGAVMAANQCFQAAVEIDPGYAPAWRNLGNGLLCTADYATVRQCYQRAMQLAPDYQEAASGLLLSLHYDPSQTPASVFAQHQTWGQGLTVDAAEVHAFPTLHSSERPLRIGYVSPDFRRHSVAYFIEPVLAAHDRDAVEIFLYSNTAHSDEVTSRLQELVGDGWRNIVAESDRAVVDLIRADAIDVLVDLAGHTGGNRLGVFALRAAPVQITYLGYPGTTGLANMDYRITDAWADPQGISDECHTETLLRLPNGFFVYRPPANAPDVKPLPCTTNAGITFGSFNALQKISPLCVELWSEVLRAVPDSRLLLKAGGLGEPALVEYYYQRFQAQGIDPQRLQLRGQTAGLVEHLDSYSQVDLCLDTIPYHGTTTSCEALWMGRPVLTLAGDSHVSRVGVSLLQCLGLEEYIAASPQDFVQKAVHLAEDPSALVRVQPGLRKRMQDCGLTDAPKFTEALESAYRAAWSGRANNA